MHAALRSRSSRAIPLRSHLAIMQTSINTTNSHPSGHRHHHHGHFSLSENGQKCDACCIMTSQLARSSRAPPPSPLPPRKHSAIASAALSDRVQVGSAMHANTKERPRAVRVRVQLARPNVRLAGGREWHAYAVKIWYVYSGPPMYWQRADETVCLDRIQDQTYMPIHHRHFEKPGHICERRGRAHRS